MKLPASFICHSENPRALWSYSKSTLSVLCKWNNKAQRTGIIKPRGSIFEYAKPTVETCCDTSEKKKRFLSKYDCWLTVHPRALSFAGDGEETQLSYLLTQHPLCSPKTGVISTLMSYSPSKALHKAIASRSDGSSEDVGKVN